MAAVETGSESERRDPRQRVVLAHSQGIRFVIPEVGTGPILLSAVAVKPMARSSFGILVRETMLEVEKTPLIQRPQGVWYVSDDFQRSLFTVSETGNVDH